MFYNQIFSEIRGSLGTLLSQRPILSKMGYPWSTVAAGYTLEVNSNKSTK